MEEYESLWETCLVLIKLSTLRMKMLRHVWSHNGTLIVWDDDLRLDNLKTHVWMSEEEGGHVNENITEIHLIQYRMNVVLMPPSLLSTLNSSHPSNTVQLWKHKIQTDKVKNIFTGTSSCMVSITTILISSSSSWPFPGFIDRPDSCRTWQGLLHKPSI